MNELISKAIGMVCAIGQAIGNMFRQEGSGDTTANAPNTASSGSINESANGNGMSISATERVSYNASLAELQNNVLLLNNALLINMRNVWMNLFMKSVQGQLDKLSLEDWKTGNYDKLKLGENELNWRKTIIENLREIDEKLGQNGIVSKSQMELLGRLRPAASRTYSLYQYNNNKEEYDKFIRQVFEIYDNRSIDYISDEEIRKRCASIEADGYEYGWQDDWYDFDRLNGILQYSNVTDGYSLKHLFTQSSSESNFAHPDFHLQGGVEVDKTGAGMIQLTGRDPNYIGLKEYLKGNPAYKDEMGIIEMIDYFKDSNGNEIGKGQAKNHKDRGPGLVAEKYYVEAGVYFWQAENRDADGNMIEESVNARISKNHDITLDEVTKKTANGMFNTESEYRGHNYNQKQIIFELSDGIFN